MGALNDNQLSNYWVSSGRYDSIFQYVRHNVDAVRDDLVLMVSGERIKSRIQEYAATARVLETKEQIYSAMVIYGLLTYYDGEVFIPNKELMDQYDELLRTREAFGAVYQLANLSSKMLAATLAQDTDTMSEIMDYAHNTESPILQYNHEAELAAVVNLVYLAARERYCVAREDKAGKGFADFIFYPYKTDEDGIIVELKMDASPEEAIAQMKQEEARLIMSGLR